MTTFPPSAHIDRSEDALVIVLTGELDADGVAPLAAVVLEAPQPQDRIVQVDARSVTFCGAAGLTLLLELRRRVHDRGGRLVLRRPAAAVVRVIDLCGLDDALPTVDDGHPAPVDRLQLTG